MLALQASGLLTLQSHVYVIQRTERLLVTHVNTKQRQGHLVRDLGCGKILSQRRSVIKNWKPCWVILHNNTLVWRRQSKRCLPPRGKEAVLASFPREFRTKDRSERLTKVLVLVAQRSECVIHFVPYITSLPFEPLRREWSSRYNVGGGGEGGKGVGVSRFSPSPAPCSPGLPPPCPPPL